MHHCRVVLFGDPQGTPQLLRGLGGRADIRAIVRASIRSTQAGEMEKLVADASAPLLVQPGAGSSDLLGFIGKLHDHDADLFLINSYSMILPPAVLALPKWGAVNFHGGLLPDYRGANVTEWALINEESQSGVTAHIVDSGIDTGPVIGQRTVPLTFEDTWLDARKRINQATEELLAELLPGLLAGPPAGRPQSGGRSWRRRSTDDGRFEWSWPLRRIYNLVRALVEPHPGAWYECRGGAREILTSWTSLPRLAEIKSEILGPWRHGDVALVPRLAGGPQRRVDTNAGFHFNLHLAGKPGCGGAALERIQFANGTARARFTNCAAPEADALAALSLFARAELAIEHVEVARV